MDNKYITNNFTNHFGHLPEKICRASGRTELGGNHTDHQNGQVLAAAVNMEIKAAVSSMNDGHDGDCNSAVEIYSEGFGSIKLDISDLTPHEDEKGTAASLVRGVLAGLAEQGFKIGGFKAYISSEIPAGSGLSSSAAFEILIGRIQSELYNDNAVSYVELAKIGQFAENEYFGKPCGLMDQIACASDSIVYMDFAYDGCPIIEEIDFDFKASGYSLCITNTGGSHADLTDDYAAVPGEMRTVAEFFGQEKLRGISAEQLLEKAPEIREKAGDRALLRALHFVRETERARAEAEALKEGNFEEFLRLVKESGDSSYKLLQNIYVSGRQSAKTDKSEDQPIAVALAVSELVLGEDGVCRVHGGGFAGTIQAFVKKEAVERYKKAMDKLFGDDACQVLKVGGAADKSGMSNR